MFTSKRERFKIEGTVLDATNGESYDISEHIDNVNIKKDYLMTSFPLVVINMTTTQYLRDIMRDNDISIRIKISKFDDIDTEIEQDSEFLVTTGIVLDTVIKPYKKPYTVTKSVSESEDESDMEGRGSAIVYPYQLTGISEDLVQKNRTVINEIYSNSKVEDVIANILSTVEPASIFIDSPDNILREETIIIPPLNVIPALKFIQNVYGVYNSGLGIFFDFNSTTLFKPFNPNRELLNSVELFSSTTSNTTNTSELDAVQIDENNNVRVYTQVPPPFVSQQELIMDSLGQTTVVNSYDYNYDIVKRIYNNSTTNNKTRYFWNQFQNKIFEESHINQSLNSRSSILVTLKNIDPSYFNLNTLYRVSSDVDYVTGEYYLVEKIESYTGKALASFEALVSLRLTKK